MKLAQCLVSMGYIIISCGYEVLISETLSTGIAKSIINLSYLSVNENHSGSY